MVSSLNQASAEWASDLATSLNSWLEDHGYMKNSRTRPLGRLGEELDISRQVFESVLKGTRVVEDVSVYARLFHKTGLAEADPRQIPPRLMKMPNGSTAEHLRAWTGKQWQKFLQEQQGQNPAVIIQNKSEVPKDAVSSELRDNNPSSAAPRSSRSTVGSFVDEVIDRLSSQIAGQIPIEDAVFQGVTRALEAFESPTKTAATTTSLSARSGKPENIGELCDRLYQLLRASTQTSRIERDKIANKYGDQIARVLPYIHAFYESDSEKREQRLSTIIEIEL